MDTNSKLSLKKSPVIGARGFTILELLVAIAIFGILVAIAVPLIRSSTLNLPNAYQELGNNLRLARGYSTSKGAHFRVTISANQYVVERLRNPPNTNIWTPDPAFPPTTVTLPAGITVSVGAGAVIEFNTRGLVYPVPAGPTPPITTITLTDATGSKTLQVWPSGQIQEM